MAHNPQWQLLLNPDGTATPMFIEMLNAFFNALDPQNSGYIWPETYSQFLDVNGFFTEHNVWKNSHRSIWGGQLINNADAEFKIACENFGFEHIVVDRNPAAPFRLPQGIGGTPLLSRRGFIDITTLETAGLPQRGFTGLNAALRHYNVWSEFVHRTGGFPRGCLPATVPAAVSARIAHVGRIAQQRKDGMLQGNAARIALEARGRQSALDSIDGPMYVYRY